MNKEQIILDVYRNYCVQQARKLISGGTYQEFINKCKTDNEFSENWGLKVEERELSYEERCDIFQSTERFKVENREHIKELNIKIMNDAEIPTKLITLIYKNEKIENYE